MTFKPPWSLPTTDGTDVGAPVMQAPPAVHLTIEASKGWLDMMGAGAQIIGDRIVDYYSSNITQFVQSHRQQNALGGLEQSSRWMTVPGLDLNHVRSQGREIIRIIARPESAPAGVAVGFELNFDGYVVWVHLGGGEIKTYDLVMNGYTLVSDYTPDDNSAVIVMFGLTALRCQSLHDLINPLAEKKNGGLVGQVVPGRGKISAPNVPAHADVFGYFIMGNATQGWNDQYNPIAAPFDGTSKKFPDRVVIPKISKVIQFKETGKSPLLNKANVFAIQPHSFLGGASDVATFDVLEAEFYSRGDARLAFSGWTTSAAGGLAVNDKPFIWEQDLENQLSLQLDFDFSSPKTNLATMGDTTAPSTQTKAQIVAADAYTTAHDAWQKQVNAAETTVAEDNAVFHMWDLVIQGIDGAGIGLPNSGEFVSSFVVYFYPWSTWTFLEYQESHEADARAMFASNVPALAAAQIASENASYATDVAATQAALTLALQAAAGSIGNHPETERAAAQKKFNTLSAEQLSAHNDALAQINGVLAASQAAWTQYLAIADAAIATGPSGGPGGGIAVALVAINSAKDAVSAKLTIDEAALNNLLAHPPAPFTVQKVASGGSIDAFNHREITVSGDVWSFGPWSQG